MRQLFRGRNSTGETRPSKRVGSSRGVVKNSQSYSSRRETTAVTGLKCETGCMLPQ